MYPVFTRSFILPSDICMISTVVIALVCLCLSSGLATATDELQSDMHTTAPGNPFDKSSGIDRRLPRKSDVGVEKEEALSSKNNWGFNDEVIEWPEKPKKTPTRKNTEMLSTTTTYYEEVDPNRNGLLKDIGAINVGFGVGVGVPGNDPVRVASRIGVGFGASGLAGQLPIGQDIYPRQGERQSLNDYDGNKANIVPDRARKYWQAVKEGRIKIPHYRSAPSIVGVGGNIGVGTGG